MSQAMCRGCFESANCKKFGGLSICEGCWPDRDKIFRKARADG